MSINFACPHCGKQTVVADQFAGQTGPCGGCGQPITIPAAVAGAVPGQGNSSKTALIIVLAILVPGMLACGGILVAILLPAVQKAREAAYRTQCMNNMKQLALAMHNYHEAHGTMPPAFTVDENGKPLHSWRTLLLPYLEEQGLAQQIDMKEPWDSPKNQAFASRMPRTYGCPSDEQGRGLFTTDYVVIKGNQGMFEELKGGKGRKLADIIDGTSNTFMIVEIPGMDVPWMKPQDIDIDEFIRHEVNRRGGRTNHGNVFSVAFADGSVRSMRLSLSTEARKAFATRGGGEIGPFE